ncbi:MAG TPA: nuclear transport factor 2 family protein [Kineobactrum sp.]
MSTELSVADKLAIHELLARAAYALDERDMDMLAASFAVDARFTMRIAGGDLIGPFEGRDGIMGLMSSSMAEQTDKRRHAVSNIFFEADVGEGAVVISNLTLMATENDAIKLLTAGVYRDHVVQRDGVWQLQSRHLDLDKSY